MTRRPFRPVLDAAGRPLQLTVTEEPFTILVANLKGGSGKSTTAWCMASVLAAYGNRVLAVDADPTSQSLSDSHAVAAAAGPVPFRVIAHPYADRFAETVAAEADDADVIIIDTGGEASARPADPTRPVDDDNPLVDLGPFDVAGLLADEVICPFAPSKMDGRRLVATHRAVSAFAVLSSRDPGYRLLMVRVPTGFAADGAMWRAQLEKDWPIMAAEIPDRAEYRRVFGVVADGGAYRDVVDELLYDRAETIAAEIQESTRR